MAYILIAILAGVPVMQRFDNEAACIHAAKTLQADAYIQGNKAVSASCVPASK